jgi:hypothetical protein
MTFKEAMMKPVRIELPWWQFYASAFLYTVAARFISDAANWLLHL